MRDLIAGVIAGGIGLALVTAPVSASAAETNNLKPLYVGEDTFYNYDHHDDNGASNRNVDWPVTLLFWNNAEVDRIKTALAENYGCGGGVCAGTKYLYLNDGSGGSYDADKGNKADPAPCKDTRHYRLYADGDDRMYNTTYGYYVLGTTHKDVDEFSCPGDPRFVESEQTERNIGQYLRGEGYSVVHDHAWFHNGEGNCPRSTAPPFGACAGRQDAADGARHQWQNSGYATYIKF